MIKKLLYIFLPTLLFANPFETTLQDEMQWLEEETFVVSASRVKENIKKTSASVNVIDEEMIEVSGIKNISELLNTVPGISVTQGNIFFNEIEVRGIKDFTSKQVLFMIDGHSIDALLLNGGAAPILDKISLDNIKRVEIVKGPASALYGANAFTALINIITKDAADINGVIVNSKIGSYNTKEINLLYGKQFDELSLVANINVKDTDGNKVYVKQDRANKSATNNPYLKQLTANIKVNYKDFYMNSMYLKRDDGEHFGPLGEIAVENDPKLDYLFIETGYNKQITEKLNLSTRLYFDKYKFDNYWHLLTIPADLKMKNSLTNEKNGIESLLTYKVNTKLTSILGATYEKHKQYDVETIVNSVNLSNTSNTFAPNVNRNMWALYTNNIYDLSDNIRLTVGIRHDNYSDFGSNTAPRGGLSWQINNNNILKAIYGEGFRTPTFAESYNASAVIQGNTNLTPEKVKTYELSYENSSIANLNSKITYFNNNFDNLIIQSGTIYINQGETSSEGIEIETKYDLTRGSYLMANYTYQKAKDKINNTDLADIAKHKGNIFFNYKINKFLNINNHIELRGKMKRITGDNRADVAGYALVNVSMQLKNFYKNLELKATINNLFDKEAYDPSRVGFTVDDYEKEGRNFMFELKYAF